MLEFLRKKPNEIETWMRSETRTDNSTNKLRAEEEERQAQRQVDEVERHARLTVEEDERWMEILKVQANPPPAGQCVVSDAGRALRPKHRSSTKNRMALTLS